MKRKRSRQDGGGLTYTEVGLIGVLFCLAIVLIFSDLGREVIETYTEVSVTAELEI